MKDEGEHPLIGSAFHTVDERGRTEWQGEFLADCGQGYFLARLFDWALGHESKRFVLSLEEISSSFPNGQRRFRVFKNMEAANEYMDLWAKHRDALIDSADAGGEEADFCSR